MNEINKDYVKFPYDICNGASFRVEELLEIEHALNAMQRTRGILDAKYQNYDLSKIVSDSKHVINDKQIMLFEVLTKYEYICSGTLGNKKS